MTHSSRRAALLRLALASPLMLSGCGSSAMIIYGLTQNPNGPRASRVAHPSRVNAELYWIDTNAISVRGANRTNFLERFAADLRPRLPISLAPVRGIVEGSEPIRVDVRLLRFSEFSNQGPDGRPRIIYNVTSEVRLIRTRDSTRLDTYNVGAGLDKFIADGPLTSNDVQAIVTELAYRIGKKTYQDDYPDRQRSQALGLGSEPLNLLNAGL
mgnify:FL=1